MKNINLLALIVTAILWQSNVYSQEKLDIQGAIIIGQAEDPTPTPGTIRFNETTNDFEGWNGTFWASLTGLPQGSVTDVDGNDYQTIVIGGQEWMLSNLRVSRYSNEDFMPNVTVTSAWGDLETGAYCWYFNDGPTYQVPYGRLYNGYAVEDARGICPTGWKVASEADWLTLINYVGGADLAAGALKEAGFTHWQSPNTDASNVSGFTALPGGIRSTAGSFSNIETHGNWWTTTPDFDNLTYMRMNYLSNSVTMTGHLKEVGMSVRCIKN